MPTWTDIASTDARRWSMEDQNQYAKYSAYLTMLETKKFPEWRVWYNLFGSIPWTKNMGPKMQGIRAEPSPVVRQEAYPNPIQELSLTDFFGHKEVSEDAILKKHRFMSNQIPWLPSFQDFRKGQIAFERSDIERQIQEYNDIFIRSVALQKTKNCFIGTDAGMTLENCPYIPYGTDITATSVAAGGKNTAFFQAIATRLKKPLTLKGMAKISTVARDELEIPFWENGQTKPVINEILKGKYAFLGDAKSYFNLVFDPTFKDLKNTNVDKTADGFTGTWFGQFTWHTQRRPMRFDDNGVFHPPQITTEAGETIANPAYTASNNLIGWLLGDDFMKTLEVGAPPSEFASQNLSMQKLAKLSWNGQVITTDNILIKQADGSYITNTFGDVLQLQAQLALGAIVKNGRYAIPVFYRASVINEL